MNNECKYTNRLKQLDASKYNPNYRNGFWSGLFDGERLQIKSEVDELVEEAKALGISAEEIERVLNNVRGEG